MPVDPAVEAAIRERAGSSAFAQWFGLEIARVDDGECEIRLAMEDHHLNPGGIAHGGVIATLLDAAIGLALRSRMGLGSTHVTLNLDIQYIAMARAGTLVAHGTAVHTGSRAAHGDGTLRDESGKLLARASATFLIVDPERLRGHAEPAHE